MDRVLGGLTTLLQASQYLSCPAHCSPSIWGPFAVGIVCGFSLAVSFILLGFVAFITYSPHLLSPPERAATIRLLSRRLGGYLHEQ